MSWKTRRQYLEGYFYEDNDWSPIFAKRVVWSPICAIFSLAGDWSDQDNFFFNSSENDFKWKRLGRSENVRRTIGLEIF